MQKLLPFLFLLPAFGCASFGQSLTPAQEARLERFECSARALAPLVEPTLDAAELLKDLYAGKADLGAVLSAVAASQAEVVELLQRLKACGIAVEVDEAVHGGPEALQARWEG